MTLQELLHSVAFSNVWPCIVSFDPDMKHLKDSFHRAFRVLQTMPAGVDDGVEIEIDYIDDGYPDEGIGAYHCNDTDWETALARSVKVVPDLLRLSDETIAALSLWEITFYGFSEEQIRQNLDSSLKQEARKYNDLLHYCEMKWKFPLKWIKNRKRMNGPKRNRARRQALRLKELRKLARIENICNYIARYRIKGLPESYLLTLKDAEAIYDSDYSVSNRIRIAKLADYLINLMSADNSFSNDTRTIILISADERYSSEVEKLRHYISASSVNPEFYCGVPKNFGMTLKIIHITDK